MKTADRWKSNPYTNENGDRGCNEYVLKDFSSKSSLGGFEEYLLASPHILNRITGLINHDFRDNVFFLETQSHEFEQNDDYLIRCTCDYSNNTIIISFNGKELYSKYKKTCRSWAQARKYIIELINMLEDMKKEGEDDGMKQNVKIAKQLMKLAKELMADNKEATYGLMFENPDAPKRKGDFPILKINVNESDIMQSQFFEQMYKMGEEKLDEWEQYIINIHPSGYSKEEIDSAKDYLKQVVDLCFDSYGVQGYIEQYVVDYIENIINGLKELAEDGTTYMSGNFEDWSKYYNRQPMKNAQDVIEAAYESLEALGTFGFKYNFSNELNNLFYTIIKEDLNNDDEMDEVVRQIIEKEY